MLPPSPGAFQELFGGCSQAMIFPRERVLGLIEFLEKKGKGQVDLLLKDLANGEGFDTYALYPVQALRQFEEQRSKRHKLCGA
ncbi:hypothetical protein ACJ72_01838 [Emergomyces africanus]|uniref:Uncharacterized protein n=1 Tax=Emergomyces africanus TaxID=1955775 RepID=A0A1B7P441_9EURO|nr:hypothetical protein ACJ72_01838 [Emergomyces africanus]